MKRRKTIVAQQRNNKLLHQPWKLVLESHILKMHGEFGCTCGMELKSILRVKASCVGCGKHMLLFTGAENLCIDFISKMINSRNCLDVIAFAETISSEGLMGRTVQFLEKNYVEIGFHRGTKTTNWLKGTPSVF